jgi:hypothetical protein
MLLSIGDFPEIHRTEGVKEITLLHEPWTRIEIWETWNFDTSQNTPFAVV